MTMEQYSANTIRQAEQVAPGLMSQARVLANSAGVTADMGIRSALGQQFDGDRDVYDVLGYKDEVDAEDYRAKYERQDIAQRIVKLPADHTWREPPIISDDGDEDSESDFETKVNELASKTKLWHYLRRVDTVAGIGEYGLLFIGFSDNRDLSEPVNSGALSGPDDIAFYSPFAQDSVSQWTLGKEDGSDPSDPRYNLPITYDIDFSDIGDEGSDLQKVHWTRIIHIAEDKDESEIKGTPRLKAVYNRLDDREKTVGSSAEMFWTGADRKLQFDVSSDESADIPDDELDQLDDEVQKLVHDMQQYIKTFNTDIEVIGGEEVDPSGVMEQLDKSIAGATGIPKRILTGSERGELASTQDRANWFDTIKTRQNSFAAPMILRVLIDRLREYSVLPDPSEGTYNIGWPNLFELNELEKAEVMQTRAEALERMAPQGNTDLIADPEELFDFVVNGDRPSFDSASEAPIADMDPQAQNQWEDFLDEPSP